MPTSGRQTTHQRVQRDLGVGAEGGDQLDAVGGGDDGELRVRLQLGDVRDRRVRRGADAALLRPLGVGVASCTSRAGRRSSQLRSGSSVTKRNSGPFGPGPLGHRLAEAPALLGVHLVQRRRGRHEVVAVAGRPGAPTPRSTRRCRSAGAASAPASAGSAPSCPGTRTARRSTPARARRSSPRGSARAWTSARRTSRTRGGGSRCRASSRRDHRRSRSSTARSSARRNGLCSTAISAEKCTRHPLRPAEDRRRQHHRRRAVAVVGAVVLGEEHGLEAAPRRRWRTARPPPGTAPTPERRTPARACRSAGPSRMPMSSPSDRRWDEPTVLARSMVGRVVEPDGPRGPLRGIRVVELASIGPIPFCGMVLSDMGADVIRRRSSWRGSAAAGPRPRAAVRRRRPEAARAVSPSRRRLVARADVLIEGYRPGVAERLGLGPDECMAGNPRLVYGRLTGWGRSGPLADRAGHDIDYLAVGGALGAFGRAGEAPVPPLSIIADLGAGGLLLAYGIVCALFERAASGARPGGRRGDARRDGAVHGAVAGGPARRNVERRAGHQPPRHGCALLRHLPLRRRGVRRRRCAGAAVLRPPARRARDRRRRTARPRRSDAVGAVAPDVRRPLRHAHARRVGGALRGRRRLRHARAAPRRGRPITPQITAGETIVAVDGVPHPAPAPRLDRTPGAIACRSSQPGEHTDEVLAAAGYEPAQIDALRADGVVA